MYLKVEGEDLPLVIRVPDDPSFWAVNNTDVDVFWKIKFKDGWVGFYKKKPKIDKNIIQSTERVLCRILEHRYKPRRKNKPAYAKKGGKFYEHK